MPKTWADRVDARLGHGVEEVRYDEGLGDLAALDPDDFAKPQEEGAARGWYLEQGSGEGADKVAGRVHPIAGGTITVHLKTVVIAGHTDKGPVFEVG